MLGPLIGAVARTAAKKLAEKGATKAAQEAAKKEAREEARKAALEAAKTEVKDGVKKTEYPYIEPEKEIRNMLERRPARAGSGPRLSDEAFDKMEYKKGGMVKSSASKRADGCAIKGKTRGKMV